VGIDQREVDAIAALEIGDQVAGRRAIARLPEGGVDEAIGAGTTCETVGALPATDPISSSTTVDPVGRAYAGSSNVAELVDVD
jgi:hypothetical protein